MIAQTPSELAIAALNGNLAGVGEEKGGDRRGGESSVQSRTAKIPEPSNLAVVGVGLVACAILFPRRRKR